jgi:hypothetical protein
MNLLKLPKWLLGLSALLLLGGACSVAAGRRDEQLAKDLPRMTCADLLQKGRAAPQFVTLTDVQLCQGGHAFQRDMDAAMKMYVPIYSMELKEQPPASDLRLLLEVLDDRERERLLARPRIGELTIELWTSVFSLEPWVKATVSQLYPGIQMAKCHVISVGLHEPSSFRVVHEWRDGIILIALGAVCPLLWPIFRAGHRFFSDSGNRRIKDRSAEV